MAHITARAVFSKSAVLLSGIAMICIAQTAQAGFEWKGPLAPPAAEGSGAPAPAAESLSGLEPVITWDDTNVPAPPAPSTPAMPAEKVAPVETAPVTKAPEANDGTAAVAAEPAAVEVVSGFGTDLPLVIALQQVVPAGYQFSFAKDVNPGALVSWEGGQPWQGVLADMLKRAGLGYRVQNNVVVVGTFASPAAVPAPEPVQAPAPAAVDAPSVPAMPVPAVTQEEAPAAAVAPVPMPDVPATPAVSDKASQIPDDLTAPPASVKGSAPVDIRRQKPSKLLKRITTWGDKSPSEELSVPVVPVDAAKAQEAKEQAIVSGAAAAASAPEPKVTTSNVAPTEAKPAATEQKAPASVVKWQAARGETLRTVLKRWADAAGTELYWSIDYDYRLAGDVDYAGNFDDAVSGLLEHYSDVRPQPYGQMHQQADGRKVLVIKSYDLSH